MSNKEKIYEVQLTEEELEELLMSTNDLIDTFLDSPSMKSARDKLTKSLTKLTHLSTNEQKLFHPRRM